MPDRNPLTGKRLIRVRGWFTQRGSSPDVPYFERTRMDERWIALPAEAFKDDASPSPWSIASEEGETEDPFPDRSHFEV